jgi:predicted transcriptional regulator
MTGPELRVELDRLGITPMQFAGIMRADPSTVYKWLNDRRPVPGYVITVLELLRERARAA